VNQKITRITDEIEKTKEKLAGVMARLRELEKQKNELENAELVAVIRGMKATPEEFEAFLAARRGVTSPEQPDAVQTQETGENQGEN